MRLRAKDLPVDGSSKLVLVDGVLFEVRRVQGPVDGRKFVYWARRVLETTNMAHDSGWWTRFTWDLMVRDLKLMAKQENEE